VKSTDEAAIADLRRTYDDLNVAISPNSPIRTAALANAADELAVRLCKARRSGEALAAAVEAVEICQAMDLDHRVESVEKARMERIFTSAVKRRTDLLERLGRHDEAHPVLRFRKALRPEPGDRSGEL
jgi:hypothetical protein